MNDFGESEMCKYYNSKQLVHKSFFQYPTWQEFILAIKYDDLEKIILIANIRKKQQDTWSWIINTTVVKVNSLGSQVGINTATNTDFSLRAFRKNVL